MILMTFVLFCFAFLFVSFFVFLVEEKGANSQCERKCSGVEIQETGEN